MRKKASSFVIKLILAAIIVTFIFFFGYNTMRKGRGIGGGHDSTVATVNGLPIHASEYRFFYDRIFENFRRNFKGGETPSFLRELAKNSTLQQLIGKTLALSLADKMGIVVPVQELADTIRDAQMMGSEGRDFDPVAYRHQFLPYFKGRFGLDYEVFVKEDLRIAAFGDVFETVDKASLFIEDNGPGSVTWKFEVISTSPMELVNSKKADTAEEAKKLMAELCTLAPAKWKARLAKLGLKSETKGPVTIAERAQVFAGKLEDFEKLFALTKENPVMGEPVEIGERLYIARLVEMNTNAGPAKTLEVGRPFLGAWMEKMQAEAKVHSYLEP